MISLLDLCRRIDAGALTPARAIAEAAEAARDHDSFEALVHLAERPRPGLAGALRGVAVGVKDILDTAELPTGHGSPLYAGWRPRADAAAVALLRRAGATILAKTATTPFAYADPAPTRNPRAPGRTPGGSSSGSAAAVAAGLLPLTIGTQTGGSIIRPASFCGVVGVKPSYRLVPTVGARCFSWALDTVGLFAAGVDDAAFALAVLTGRHALRTDVRVPGAPRLGVVRQGFAGEAAPESVAALERAARLTEQAGATVRDLALPAILADAFAAHPTIQDVEARQALAFEYDHHREALPPKLRALLDAAQDIPLDAYDGARSVAHRARGALKEAFAEVDALLTFAAPGAPPEGLASTGEARFNRLWTLLGTPCVAVPASLPGEWPVAVQVVAPFGRDEAALAAARFVESCLAAA